MLKLVWESGNKQGGGTNTLCIRLEDINMASGVAEVVWTSYEKKNIEEKESYMALMDQEKVDDRIDRDALCKVL